MYSVRNIILMKRLKKTLVACEKEIEEVHPFIEVFDLLAKNEITNKMLLPQNDSVDSKSVAKRR